MLKLKHSDHKDATFEVLLGNIKLERPGPPNQYFAVALQGPPPNQNNINEEAEEGETL